MDAAPVREIESTALAVLSPGALETITRSEMDVQIVTARKYRRSLAQFKSQALAMATLDQETAASCTYLLPREGKLIEGPSIRLAEIVLSTWGNLRAGTRLIDEADKTVTAQAYCHDLETNVAITVEVRRGILNRYGARYKADMVNTTAMAACAIALRNAVFSIIPKVFVEQIRVQARRIAAGDESTLADRRAKAMAHFASLGVPLERVLVRLADETSQPRAGLEDVTLTDMVLLHGFATSLRDGVASVDELFPVAAPEAEQGGSVAGRLAEDLKKRAKDKKPE